MNLDVGPAGNNSPLPSAGERQRVPARWRSHAGGRRGEVRLEAGGKVLFTEEAELVPTGRSPRNSASCRGDGRRSEGRFRRAGRPELIAYRPVQPEGLADAQAGRAASAAQEIKSNEELYLAGLRLEQFHSPALEPDPYYEEALRRDPGDSRANSALAFCTASAGCSPRPRSTLNTAIERITPNYTSPKDGEAFYYLAWP